MRNNLNKTYAEQTKGIEKSELDRRKAVGECHRCTWPGDRKKAHKTMDCFRWARNEVGTAPFPKAKEYLKHKIGAYTQEDSESEIDLDTTDDDLNEPEESQDEEDEKEPGEEFKENISEEESEPEESVNIEKIWWDSDASDSE